MTAFSLCLPTSNPIVNTTFANFKQIIKRYNGGNTQQTVLQTLYSLKGDIIKCSSDKRTIKMLNALI